MLIVWCRVCEPLVAQNWVQRFLSLPKLPTNVTKRRLPARTITRVQLHLLRLTPLNTLELQTMGRAFLKPSAACLQSSFSTGLTLTVAEAIGLAPVGHAQ